MRSSSPLRAPKLLLASEQPSTGECWIPPKRIPHVQEQRGSLSNMVGGGKSVLNIHWKDDAKGEAPILWPPDVKS